MRPIVDYVLVEDTGSTDGTQAIIREWLDRVGLPGEVYDEPWRDFAYNRSHALGRLRENKGIDYALIIDADDQLVVEAGFDVAVFKKSLSQDLYNVPLRQGLVHYQVQRLCSNKLDFHYRGVLHEFIEGPQSISSGSGAASISRRGVKAHEAKTPPSTTRMPRFSKRHCKLKRTHFFVPATPFIWHGATAMQAKRKRHSITT